MKRKIIEKLKEWKGRNGRSALLIDGARRVGKSYIVEEFAKKEYKSYILIDFNRQDKGVEQLFEDYLNDLDMFFLYLRNYFGKPLYERQSLIIFDEVQVFPRARAALKYLVADGRYDYIETGSLLSIKENVENIVIPSEEEHLKMYPMDFEEFLWANGHEELMDLVRQCKDKRTPIGDAMHRKLMELLKQYMIVGGMPQAVEEYVRTHDFDAVDMVKRRILELYRADIAKHAGGFRQRVESIFDEIPSQLSKHEKRFQLSSIGKNARMREYEDAFVWLDDAMIVNICFNSTDPNIGLRLNRERATMKCYLADTGLLISMAFDENGKTDSEIYRKLLLGKLEVNEGMLLENLAAQMLLAAGHSLYFFSNPSPTDVTERMEIDFLIAKRSITSRHNISPIEVKSGKRYTLTSLEKFIGKYNAKLATPYVVHTKDYEERDGITYVPIYMLPLL